MEQTTTKPKKPLTNGKVLEGTNLTNINTIPPVKLTDENLEDAILELQQLYPEDREPFTTVRRLDDEGEYVSLGKMPGICPEWDVIKKYGGGKYELYFYAKNDEGKTVWVSKHKFKAAGKPLDPNAEPVQVSVQSVEKKDSLSEALDLIAKLKAAGLIPDNNSKPVENDSMKVVMEMLIKQNENANNLLVAVLKKDNSGGGNPVYDKIIEALLSNSLEKKLNPLSEIDSVLGLIEKLKGDGGGGEDNSIMSLIKSVAPAILPLLIQGGNASVPQTGMPGYPGVPVQAQTVRPMSAQEVAKIADDIYKRNIQEDFPLEENDPVDPDAVITELNTQREPPVNGVNYNPVASQEAQDKQNYNEVPDMPPKAIGAIIKNFPIEKKYQILAEYLFKNSKEEVCKFCIEAELVADEAEFEKWCDEARAAGYLPAELLK